ncbi:MAG TPA: MFS transporter [Bryobacteraceae bacterium]|nr:MFS transporter [Bryobacteraceae bacterium]
MRWLILSIFVLCTSINFLDRQVLAALAPRIEMDLRLSGMEYGAILSAFALAYALGAPVAGWLVDRTGLNGGITLAAGVWSLASGATGFAGSLGALFGCRLGLGLGESVGMPALAKANAIYLPPSEYGLSLALNSIAIAIGSALAPLLAGAVAPVFGWRSAFFVTSAAGMLWIPLWRVASRRAPAQPALLRKRFSVGELLCDRRAWILTISNALIMTVYTVWTNWTTIYFVQELHLTASDANRHYVWLPPVFATLGGFFGGWLTYRWIEQGRGAAAARMRGSWLAAAFIAFTATLPLTSSPVWSAAVISLTMFWAMSLQMNVHILPLDIFGPESAGFSVSILACSYGLMQMLISPIVGAVVDRAGFPQCVLPSPSCLWPACAY